MHDRGSNPAPDDFLSERLTSELGRPGLVVKRSDKRPSGPGCDSLRLDFWAIPGRPPALSRRLDSLFVDFFSLGSTPQRPPGVTSGILPGSRPSRLPKSPFALGFSCVRFSVLIFGSLKIVTAVLSDVAV